MYKQLELDKILYYKRKNRYELFYGHYGSPLYLQLSKGYLSKKIDNNTKFIWLGYFSNSQEKHKTYNYLNMLKIDIEKKCNITLETFFYDNGICLPCQNIKGNLHLEIYLRQNEILWEDNLHNFPDKSYIIPIIYIENIVSLNGKWRINIKLIQICVFPLYQKLGKCIIDFDNNEYIEKKNINNIDKTNKLTNIDGFQNKISIKISDHPIYSKYFKMCKMGIPKAAVIIKMNNEIPNIDAKCILNKDPDEQEIIELTTVEEHEYYMRFFKMIKIGIPKAAVQQKMILENIDINYLDRGKDLIPKSNISNKKDMFSELMKIKLINNTSHDFKLDKKTNLNFIGNLNKNKNILNNNSRMTINIEELLNKRNALFKKKII